MRKLFLALILSGAFMGATVGLASADGAPTIPDPTTPMAGPPAVNTILVEVDAGHSSLAGFEVFLSKP